MIFALVDYLNYRTESGRYSLKHGSDVMCGAFENELPYDLITALKPGDVVLSGNFDWWLAWAIMYLTSSQVSHISIYAGNGQILHQTLGGPLHGPIEDLFGPKQRILPIKIPLPADRPREPFDISVLGERANTPYATGLVIRKGLKIIFGRSGRFFRVRFAVDMLVLLLLLSLPLMLLHPMALLIPPVMYLVSLLVGLSLSFFFPLQADEANGVPSDALWQLRQIGGAIIFNPASTWLQRQIDRAGA